MWHWLTFYQNRFKNEYVRKKKLKSESISNRVGNHHIVHILQYREGGWKLEIGQCVFSICVYCVCVYCMCILCVCVCSVCVLISVWLCECDRVGEPLPFFTISRLLAPALSKKVLPAPLKNLRFREPVLGVFTGSSFL